MSLDIEFTVHPQKMTIQSNLVLKSMLLQDI